MEKKIQDFPSFGRYISGIRPGMWRQSVRYQRVLATLLGASLLWSVEAPGLGLGDVELNSYLNQPLSAEISLLAVDPSNAEQITVKLASQAAFDAAGIERFVMLEDLIFEVRTNDSGELEVGVSTKGNIREPFLDFIVEVVWPNGRLLREYTLLLDPPVFTSQQAPSVAAPEMGFTIHSDDVVQQSAAQSPSQAEPSVAGAAENVMSNGVIPGSFSSPSSNSNVDPLSVPTSSGQLRVRRNETLWDVASKVLPNSDFSVEQRMLGIYKINDGAFIDNNINNLKAGYVLREPSEATVSELSHSQAAGIARQHYQDWLSAKRLAAANSSRVANATPGPASLANGAVSSPVSSNTQSRLSLVSPESDGNTGSRSATGSNQNGLSSSDLALVMAQAKESKAQSEALKSRITTLEEQLAMMERLITLKDDALVEMQRQLGGEQAQVAVGVEAAAPQEAMVEVLQPVEVVSQPELQPVEAGEVAPVAKPKVNKSLVVAEQPAEEPGLMEMLLNPRILVLGVGLLLIVAAGLMVIRKRREAAEEDYQDYEFVPEYGSEVVGDDSIAETKVTMPPEDEMDFSGLTEDGLAELPETEDFSGGGLDSFQTDEADIDPIAEADVYLAYRRFQQAEDLIKEAMQRYPDRSDLQVKLLQVYFAAENKAGFESQAEALFASLGGQENSVWAPVADMGRELCQGHPLFGGESNSDFSADDQLSDLDSMMTGVSEELDIPDMAELDSAVASISEELDIPDMAELDAAVESVSSDLDLPDMDELADDLDFSSLNSELTDDVATDAISDSPNHDSVVGNADDALLAFDELETSSDESLEVASLDEQASTDELANDMDFSAADNELLVDQADNAATDLSEDFDFDAIASSSEENDALVLAGEAGTESSVDFAKDLAEGSAVAEQATEALNIADEALDPLSDALTELDVFDSLDADAEIGALSFEALGTDVDDIAGQSFGEKVEALSEEVSAEIDPLSDGLDDIASIDDMVASADEVAVVADDNPLDDLDLSVLESNSEASAESLDASLASFEEDGDNIIDELSQSYGELEEVFTGLADSELTSGGDDDLFGGADMIGTKLDLARAYIDMEDHEGARGILQEVQEEGSDAQKQEAQEMMQKIG